MRCGPRFGLRFGLLGPPVLYEPCEGEGCEPADGPGGVYDVGGAGAGRPGLAARAVGSPKARVLLAALLLEAGRVVPVASLKDALWGGAPPASAHASLHNHVARLRRMLDDPGRLRAVPPGYLLRVEQGELDVHVFDSHVAAARAAHAGREWERAVRECARALALWRGAPLSGLPAEVGGYAFVQRLVEARLLVLEWRYDAELALAETGEARGDRLAGLVPELAALAAEHPLREAYHRQLMLALHRTGRRAEALAVHRDLRSRLVEDLGVEPGAGVRGAHVEVLRGVPETSETPETGDGGDPGESSGDAPSDTAVRPATAVTGPVAPTPRPSQLPPPPAHFTGRPAVSDALLRNLARPAALAVLSGMAGVGKSALALHAAHALTERFSDGQLYVNLHGATPGMTPLTSGQALTALLRDLGVEPRRIPEHPDAATALLRSLLAPTRTLLVLDDAASAAQVRPLLPAGAGCAVIVTSRSPLTALDGARRFPLAPLTSAESAALLRAVSGRDGLDAGHPLVELTGRLPLALRVVAARLAARRALTPDVLAGQLAATEGRLHHLEYDDLSVRRSLAVAHDALAASDREVDRDAALALRRVGALDLPSYGAPLIARLTGTDERRAEAALDRLVDVALLEETAYARYAPHDLVRDFARELAAGRHGNGADTSARAMEPVPTGQGDGSTNAARVRAQVEGADVGRVGARVEGADVGRVRARVEGADVGCVGARAEGADVARVGARAEGADVARVRAQADGSDVARVRARAEGADVGRVRAQAEGTNLARVRVPAAVDRCGAADVAHADLVDTALRWYAAVAERSLTAVVEPGLDQDDRRRPTAAQPSEHAAYVTTVAAFDGAEAAFAWGDGELGNVVALVEAYADGACERRAAYLSTLLRLLFPYLHRSGRIPEMELLGRAALALARRLGDAAAEGYALGDLAGMHFLTGRQSEALALSDQALAIWRRLGTVSWIRRCLNNRGLLLEGLGRYAESEDALRQSLGYSRRLCDPYGEAVTYSHLGNLYEHTDPRAAIEHHRRSLALGVGIGAVIVQHTAHCNIGYAHLTLGEPAAAVEHFEESLRILGGHGDWHGESQTRLGLVRALRQLGRVERAVHECAELLRRADARSDRYTGGLGRHQYGLLLRDQGREDGAHEAWRTALADLEGTDERAVVTELRSLVRGAAADHFASA
ncbi:tetratricopeptide repeat protein [Streptomyces spinoverrucosus]|uniref:BTAD domain-containing putative transcriptional regulator n=1 Tax=Streptomyces spinoverrucosus TaxID=284043 RepID=UPI0018C43247|nr:BTAD domain-containing putative transcriptional regulator [Streptomyces spinoverrucosus]MBG0853485.1 tetratricopeptide repeat protein [Streptomyces spinoverrucosus]